jgi:hypothetical protein
MFYYAHAHILLWIQTVKLPYRPRQENQLTWPKGQFDIFNGTH